MMESKSICITSFAILCLVAYNLLCDTTRMNFPLRSKRHLIVPRMIEIGREIPNESLVYRSYQTSIYCSPSMPIQYPKNISQLVDQVNEWIVKGLTMKVIGSLHSITDIICTDGVPISLKHINHSVENGDGTWSFGAGIELIDALLLMEQRKKTLIHVSAFGGITIGGALGTGSHGSSLRHPTSISDQVVRLKVIDGNGLLKEILNPEDVDAFRVHLGLLGILVEVTLSTVPLFKVKVENRLEPESILMDGTALKWAESYDYFQMWYFPSTSNVVVSKGTYVSLNEVGNATSQFIPDLNPLTVSAAQEAIELLQKCKSVEGLYAIEKFTELSLYSDVIGKPPLFSEDELTMKNPATSIGWRLMTNKCSNKCPWDNGNFSVLPEESSVAMHITKLPEVVNTIKEVLKSSPAAFIMVGIYIRFSKSSTALLAISYDRPTVTVEWSTPMRSNPLEDPKHGIAAYQAILQSMIYKFDGRAHYGKNGLYYFTKSVLQKSLKNRDKFMSYMKQYDPKGIFRNKFSERMLGLSDNMDIDPKVKRCALQDYCICSKPEDCGLDQICTKLNGFPVCSDSKEVPTKSFDSQYDDFNSTSILNAISSLF